MCLSCPPPGNNLCYQCGVNHVSADRNGAQPPAAATLSVMPDGIIHGMIRLNPDSVPALRAVSRELHRISEDFLQWNAVEMARRCSSMSSPLCRRIYSNFIDFSVRLWSEPSALGVRFHLSVSHAVRSMGVPLAGPPARILHCEDVGRVNEEMQAVQDANLQRVWGRIREQTFFHLPAGLPEEGASAEEIRTWMQAYPPRPIFCRGLRLSRLQLTCVPIEIALLTGLVQLDLNENQLVALPEGLFQRMGELRTLDLSNNQLVSLPEDLFQGMPRLSHLDLRKNQLVSLPRDLFHGLPELGLLNLQENHLASLPETLFNGLANLYCLSLYSNRLDSLPGGLFNGLARLQELTLSRNQLDSLSPGLFNGLNALSHLQLQLNPLCSLPEGLFDGLVALERLYLSSEPLLMYYENWYSSSCPLVGAEVSATVHDFFHYQCQTPLSTFYQFVAGNFSPEAVRGSLDTLPSPIKNGILRRVWIQADRPNLVDDSLEWGEQHALDDMKVFAQGLKGYVKDSFTSLPSEQRSAVYSLLDPNYAVDPTSVMLAATDNILRFIDALMQVRE